MACGDASARITPSRATLSHELRTPLNAILGWSQILRHNPKPEDVDEGVQVIERNARVQTQIIEDLLDMSRIISGKFRLDVQRIDLPAVVKAAVETVTPAADARGVRIQTVLDPVAGPVSGDPNRLQQVFWELHGGSVRVKSGGVGFGSTFTVALPPNEDGYSLIRSVRALGGQAGGATPAIALAAYARAEDRMKAVLAGFEMHVVKPVESAELITMVASLTRRIRR